MTETESIRCLFVRYRYKSPEFSVIMLERVDGGQKITAVGSIPNEMCLKDGKTLLDISGAWSEHKTYGRQFKVFSIGVPLPQDAAGIEAYLSSGVVKGIGPTTARNMIKAFGAETLNILDDNPLRITEVAGIGAKTAQKIMESWTEQRQTARLLTTLCSLGLSVSFARKAFRLFGVAAAAKIQANPYLLIRLRGVGFFKADEIARRNGISETAPERINAGLTYTLQEATYTQGHCYLPVAEWIERAHTLLEVRRETIQAALSAVSESMSVLENITVVRESGRELAYLTEVLAAEQYVSARIGELVREKSKCADIPAMNVEAALAAATGHLTPEQVEAVKVALLSGRLSVITGLPGVGKTTSVKTLIGVLESLGLTYQLAAPTGRAAKRLAEQTSHEARTIHRLLEVQKNGTFARCEGNPLETGFVIIDETSMIDIRLMADLMKAVQYRTSLVLIGDPHQLPSVGPGRILADLLDRNLCPNTQLTRIQRQAADSPIIAAAHRIHAGLSPLGLEGRNEYRFMVCVSPEDVRDTIVNLVASASVPADVQVLSPMKKGVCGTVELNRAIQRRIIPATATVTKIPFFIGDRVIQTLNNYDKEVFNGEIGYVTAVNEDDRELTVHFPDRAITYDSDDWEQISLAYAITVHKSQGSEFPTVIIPAHTQHYVMLYRNLIYTAVTRARQNLVIVGTAKALGIAVRNNKQLTRYSGLCRL